MLDGHKARDFGMALQKLVGHPTDADGTRRSLVTSRYEQIRAIERGTAAPPERYFKDRRSSEIATLGQQLFQDNILTPLPDMAGGFRLTLTYGSWKWARPPVSAVPPPVISKAANVYSEGTRRGDPQLLAASRDALRRVASTSSAVPRFRLAEDANSSDPVIQLKLAVTQAHSDKWSPAHQHSRLASRQLLKLHGGSPSCACYHTSTLRFAPG